MRQRRALGLFASFLSLVGAGKLSAQCQNGLDFAVCPSADVIYITTSTTVTAMSLSAGAVKWHISPPHQTEDGFVSAAATDGVVAIWEGIPGTRIYAFDAATGKPMWKVDTSADDLIGSERYILSNDAAHWEGITARTAQTGKIIWHHGGRTPDRVRFYVSRDRTILTNLFAINADTGRILARWPRRWAVSAGAFGGNFAVIATSYADGRPTKLAVYSLPAYSIRWAKADPQRRPFDCVAADADHVFVALYPKEGGGVFQPGGVQLEMLDSSSGKTIWTKQIMSATTLPAAVGLTDGVAVFVTDDSTSSSVIEGFDVASGQSKWQIHSPERLVGQIVCANSSCYTEAAPVAGNVLEVNVQTGAQSWFRVPTK